MSRALRPLAALFASFLLLGSSAEGRVFDPTTFTLANGLGLLGVQAPDRLDSAAE